MSWRTNLLMKHLNKFMIGFMVVDTLAIVWLWWYVLTHLHPGRMAWFVVFSVFVFAVMAQGWVKAVRVALRDARDQKQAD